MSARTHKAIVEESAKETFALAEDIIRAKQFQIDALRVELEKMRDGISDMKAAMQSEIDAAIQRGDTYRTRAMAIMKSARLDREAAVIALHQDNQIIDALRGELDKDNRPNYSLDEALNSGDGVYRP